MRRRFLRHQFLSFFFLFPRCRPFCCCCCLSATKAKIIGEINFNLSLQPKSSRTWTTTTTDKKTFSCSSPSPVKSAFRRDDSENLSQFRFMNIC